MSFGRRSNRCDFAPASVCEEDVDVAVLLFDDGIETVEIIQARYVACDRRNVSPDQGCGLFQLFLPSASDYDVSAFFHEALGCGQAYATIATRDDCNLTFKLSHDDSLRNVCSIRYSRVEFFGGGRELLDSPNILSIRPNEGGHIGSDNRHLQDDARNRFRSAQARSHSPMGLDTGKTDRGTGHAFRQKDSPTDLAHFAMLLRGNCWLTVEGIPEPIPLTGGDCFLLARGTSIILRDSPRTRPRSTFREIGAKANSNVALYGGGGAPTTIVCGSFSFDRASLKPITQLLPSFILIKADQARTIALHSTVQALASEMAEQAPGSGVVATRLAEVLFIQLLRAHITAGPERNKGWLRAVFDPQMGTALSAIHDRVNTPWTVESLAEAAGMSRSAFAARFKELLGQTPLEYVTEWRMQKAMQLLEQRDKKLIRRRSVGRLRVRRCVQ